MVHELVRYMKSVNMHGEKIKVKRIQLSIRKTYFNTIPPFKPRSIKWSLLSSRINI